MTARISPLDLLLRRRRDDADLERRVEPQLDAAPAIASEVFDTGRRTIVDCAHVRVERLDTQPVLFSKVFKEFADRQGQVYDYRYWSERENFFLREFLKKQSEFTHVVQARHLISENEAAKQVLTLDAGITVANWLRVKARYGDTATLSNPFQRADAFLQLLRGCLAALKQIHRQRIVHCDIKEDNICVPYAPHPFQGGRRRLRLEYGRLKLIDFAFSVAHAMPLSQILVIDPDERLPYQSARLIAALRADRRSGSPNAVQQLDYGVDLFSLGHLAGKISAAGLDCPPGPAGERLLEDIQALLQRLKDYDDRPAEGPLPHDDLIAEADRLLAAAASGTPLEFNVDGEWSAQEMARSGTARQTPQTPVALPPPTPVSLPFLQAAAPPRPPKLSRAGLAAGLGVAFTLAAAYAAFETRDLPLPAPTPPAASTAPAVDVDAARTLAAQLRGDDEHAFQLAFAGLAKLPKPEQAALARAAALEYGEALAAAGPREARARALSRLAWMAKAGESAAARRVAEFEKGYDEVKQTVARSAWWSRGEGPQPEAAPRWMENGALLAELGDRPAMLDRAFALAHGRGAAQDRTAAAAAYLTVLDRSPAGDAGSRRIRQAAQRGLASMLNSIAEQKDDPGARGVLPTIRARAEAGAADLQYFSGLLSECALQPADTGAALRWYRRAAADPGWKAIAERKARVLGRWCPGPPQS